MKKVLIISTLICSILYSSNVYARSKETGDVARIGNSYYSTLKEAVNDIGEEATITLIDNVTLTEKLSIIRNKKVVLDLDGKTLNLADIKDNYALVVGGNLTITGNGIVNIPGLYGIGVQPSGNLTVTNSAFNQPTGDYLIGNWGTTTINNGVFSANYSAVNGFAGSAVIINDGIFTGNDWPLVVGNVIVSGGLYNRDISDYLSDDTVILTLKVAGTTDNYRVMAIPKGTVFSRDTLSQIEEEIRGILIPDNYILEGIYIDEGMTDKFNLGTTVEDNTTLFLKLVLNKTEEEVPKTSDNIVLIIITILIGISGTVILLRNKIYKREY